MGSNMSQAPVHQEKIGQIGPIEIYEIVDPEDGIIMGYTAKIVRTYPMRWEKKIQAMAELGVIANHIKNAFNLNVIERIDDMLKRWDYEPPTPKELEEVIVDLIKLAENEPEIEVDIDGFMHTILPELLQLEEGEYEIETKYGKSWVKVEYTAQTGIDIYADFAVEGFGIPDRVE